MRKKLLLVAGLALVSLPVAAYAAVLAPGPHSSFRVRGANIYDPLGHRFIVRGAVIAPGALTDPQGGFDAKELAGVKHDAKVLASMGVNTVRLDVSAIANSDERLAAIRRAVTAARSAHLIVILSAHGGTSQQALEFAAYLAGRFHKDRGVWLQPAFDPSCDGADADRKRCISWTAWRAEQRALVHAIRSGGMHSPILLSTPRRSGDLRLLAHYHLTDPGIIYGVHFHGGPRTKLSLANRKRLGALFAGPAHEAVPDHRRRPRARRAERTRRPQGLERRLHRLRHQLDDQPRRRRRHRRGLDPLRPPGDARAPRQRAVDVRRDLRLPLPRSDVRGRPHDARPARPPRRAGHRRHRS